MQDGNNDVRQWLPADFQETRDYDRFIARFGSEEMAVVSWPGATINDERLDRVAKGLMPYVAADGSDGSSRAATTSSTAATPQALFSRVLTTRQAIEELTAEPIRLSRAEAIDRLQGALLGPDGRTAALLVMVNEAGAADRHRALDTVYRVAEQAAGLSRDELRMGGPTVESVALDNESERSRYLLASISVVVALGLAWRCLRHVKLVLMVFATALLCAAASVALVYFTGERMNLLLVMMPTLVYVLGLSGSVHLVNYYRDAVADGPIDEAPTKAVRAAWLPCVMSAATTAIGLGSLGISDVIPVKLFGLYSAAGVLISLPVVLVFLPAALQLWPVRSAAVGDESACPAPSGWKTPVASWISRRHGWVTVAVLAVMAGMGLGVLRLETSVKLLNLFSPDSRIIRDYAWLEQHLGPLVPIEIVLQFDKDSPLTMLQKMELVSEVQSELDAIDEVGGTISAATFGPALPQGGGGVEGLIRRRVLERRLEQHRDYFSEVGYVRGGEQADHWRISARVEALNSLDYGEFMERLVERVEPVLASSGLNNGDRPEAVYTGIVPLIYKAQRTLLNDLMSSFVTAFLIVAGVMVVMLRSLRAGLVSMIPNILPAVVIFGGMGLSGMLCDIGSMMTAGVALGIAVDDTIHYLSWFRRGLDQGLSRRKAIFEAYERCAGAMIQTTVVCGLGLLVFAFSSFVPTSRFAWLMATMLGAGLLGDLILLPALLAGPLGRFFERPQPIELEPAMAEEQVVPGHLQPIGA